MQHCLKLIVFKIMRIFETIKPAAKQLRKYISYYYVDIADDENHFNEYICYPHYNSTLSLYKNHTVSFEEKHSIVSFEKKAKPLQIYTPLREDILKVTQKGPVYKIGIVFEPFGFNQFVTEDLAINKRICSPSFNLFKDELILQLFNETDLKSLVQLLDHQLLNAFTLVENQYIEKAIQLFHTTADALSIDELAENKLGISRKHLNRLFKKYIGTSAQKYRSIVRFRQLMNHKLDTSSQGSLSALSHQAHYTDQSHFIKACKQLTGLTPSQFFKDGKIVGSEDTFWKFTS